MYNLSQDILSWKKCKGRGKEEILSLGNVFTVQNSYDLVSNLELCK